MTLTRPSRTARPKGPLRRLSLLALATVAFAGGVVGFVPSPGTNSRNQRDDSVMLRRGQATKAPRVGVDREPMGRKRKRVTDMLIDEDILFKVTDDGMILREVYPGGRSWWSVFGTFCAIWMFIGFFIVGYSAIIKENIVNWTPFTRYLLWFLKFNETIQPWPQGFAMAAWGVIGGLMSLFQAWLLWFNVGFGVGEFNKNTERYKLVRDNEIIQDVDFLEIEKVCFQYEDEGVFSGKQMISVKLASGEYLDVINEEHHSKMTMEAKAVQLTNFLGLEMEVNGSMRNKTDGHAWQDGD